MTTAHRPLALYRRTPHRRCRSFDAAGRPLRVSNPFFLTSTAAATEPASFASTICTTARQWNLTTYDALGRVTVVQLADGSGATSSYSGLSTTTYDANGHASSQTVNALGEVVSSTDAAGLTLNFTYQPDGNLAQVTRDAGRGLVTTTFGYDTLGRKTSQSDLDSGTTSYEVNALGEVIAQVDGNQHRIERHLDARGRVWQDKAYRWTGSTLALESTATFVFDTASSGLGQLTSESLTGTAGSSRSYGYDALVFPSLINRTEKAR